MMVGSAKLADSVLGLSITQQSSVSEFPEEKRQQRNAQRKKTIYPGKVFENVQSGSKSHDRTQHVFLWVLTGPSDALTRVQLGLNLLRLPREAI